MEPITANATIDHPVTLFATGASFLLSLSGPYFGAEVAWSYKVGADVCKFDATDPVTNASTASGLRVTLPQNATHIRTVTTGANVGGSTALVPYLTRRDSH